MFHGLPRFRYVRLLATSAAVVALCWHAAIAMDGPVCQLPNAPATAKIKYPSGLVLQLDGRGIDATGYRPIEVTISTWPPKRKLKADRQVRVVLGCHGDDYRRVTQVSQVIELPEGTTSTTATILVPQLGHFSMISLETFEGGQKLDDLSQGPIGWPTTNNWGWNWTESRPALLFIDSKVPSREEQQALVQAYQTSATDSGAETLPDVRRLMTLFPEPMNQAGQPFARAGARRAAIPDTAKITDAVLLTLLSMRSRVAMLPPDELPARWIEMSQFDAAVISLADLTTMAKSQPKQLAALRNWLSAGPLLIVYGCGEKFDKLPQIEKLLELPPLWADDFTPELLGWSLAPGSARIGGLKTPFDENGNEVTTPAGETTYGVQLNADGSFDRRTSALPDDDGQRPFALRNAGAGCVAALAADKPFPGKAAEWSWVFNAAGESHWKWYKRAGFSMQRTNPDYWKLLIPGVGQAPALSYLLLVSLFAVVIGPVNYLLLDRARRLYLLLITVPVGALFVTAALLAFALVSDGVRTRVRVRSFADLDQKTGRAAVWSRQSYYSSIAPSQGLHFPDDTVVFPVAYQPGDRSRSRSTLLAWDGNQQLRGGYLASRTATQFMVCRATTSPAKLLVTEAGASGGIPKVENRLGTNIKYLLLCDARGECFATTAIRDKGTAALAAIDTDAAQKAMQAMAAAVKPEVPEGFDDNTSYDSLFKMLGARRNWRSRYDSTAGDPLMNNSLLESDIAKALTPAIELPPPRSYIAIVETSPLVVTGVGPVNEEASFHVIRGHY